MLLIAVSTGPIGMPILALDAITKMVASGGHS
jgi:hypothetical protein